MERLRDRPRTALQAPPQEERDRPATPAGLMLDAQARLGNRGAAALARTVSGATLQREPSFVEATDTVANMSYGDPADFLAHGPFGPADIVPDSGGRGGFEATYDPAAQELRAVMRCAVVFQDALTVSGGTVTPYDPSLTNLVANVPPPGPARTAFVARYQWQEAEKQPFLDQLKASVESVWSQKHEFHVNRPGWEHVGATVKVDIQVHGDVCTGDEHLTVDTVKFPQGENLYSAGGFSSTSPGAADNAQDQSMIIASTDVQGRPDNSLVWQVHFPLNSSDLSLATVTNNGQVTNLTTFVTTFNGTAAAGTPGGRPAAVALEGHASQSGSDAHNMKLSQARADAVRTFLTGNGFTNVASRVNVTPRGEAGANPVEDPNDRRVDMVVDSGDAQILAAHEFGHAFGLDDEYAVDPGGWISGTGNATGTQVGHDQATRDMITAGGGTGGGAVAENNDNIMSLGNRVLPQHYSMFHVALTTVTGVPEWALGPATGGVSTASGVPAATLAPGP